MARVYYKKARPQENSERAKVSQSNRARVEAETTHSFSGRAHAHGAGTALGSGDPREGRTELGPTCKTPTL